MDPDLPSCFDQNRPHLRAVAQRILGSVTEADDAVQEAWLRAARAETEDVQNLVGWLTTIVARTSLDLLRTRKSRREEPSDDALADRASAEMGPEESALLSDAVGPAMLVVLDALSPGERVAFVLHDLFALPFEDIAPILDRSPAAARQLASRARRRIRGATADPAADLARRRAVVEAFLAASREGDFGALLRLLDPDAILRADAVVAASGAPPFLAGADAVAQTFVGRARAARLSLIDGEPGALWSRGGRPQVAFAMTVVEDRITTIELIGDPEVLGSLELTVP